MLEVSELCGAGWEMGTELSPMPTGQQEEVLGVLVLQGAGTEPSRVSSGGSRTGTLGELGTGCDSP